MTQADGDGRLRGDVMDLGAATGRHTHKVIANIPSPRAMYGSEIRSLFITPKDKVLVSADGAAYQIRILAHYLKDEGYVDTILNGDAHQRHADIMGVSRAEAKPIFFSVIFGAGAGKVASYLGADQKTGKKVLDKLKNGIPGYADLEQKAKRIAQQNGWIPGPDGRKIYVEDDYKALNYLIQGTEAVLMKATIVAINKAFEDNGIEAKQLLMYHDECTWEVDPENAQRASDIIKFCFKSAPKQFGFDIFEAGDVNVGSNYLEVH
jgi:DNA polymerase I-like protein with 3'-5' exonuclease and polymerase domains